MLHDQIFLPVSTKNKLIDLSNKNEKCVENELNSGKVVTKHE